MLGLTITGKKKNFSPLKNELSWRRVFTAGFYVSLIVALKPMKGRELELKILCVSICVCLSV